MAGINRYASRLYTEYSESRNKSEVLQKSIKPEKPCIFLSHKSEDRTAVNKIGEYIKEKGVDIYLDIDDPNLQRAVQQSNHQAITDFIEIGIHSSTNLLTIISEKTRYSWWVPYEIGFGKSADKHVATMKLKNVEVPSYLRITQEIRGTDSLDKYLSEVRNLDKLAKSVWELAEAIRTSQGGAHPLSQYLETGV